MKLLLSKIKNTPIDILVFYLFILTLSLQTRVIYNPSSAYISWYFSFPLAMFLYLSDILFLACLVSYATFQKIIVSRNKPQIYSIAVFVLWVFLTLFYVKHIEIAYYQAFKWLELGLISAYIGLRLNKYIWYTFSLGLIYVLGLFEAILGILQFHVQHGLALRYLGEYVPLIGVPGSATIDIGSSKLIRAYGTFPHPNVLGAFLVISLIIGLFFVSRATRNYWLILCSICNIILVNGIFLSFSRVAWISVFLTYLLFMFHKKSSRTSFYILISGIVSCGTIVGLWNTLLFSRITNITSSNSYIDRGTFNRYAIDILKLNPFTGTGVGNYIPRMIEMFHVQPWQYQPPHNIFVYVAASLGLVGLVLFLYLLWQVLRSIWSTPSSDLKFSLLVMFFILIFMSNFDHFLVTIQQGQLLFFTCLGFIAAYRNLEKENATET